LKKCVKSDVLYLPLLNSPEVIHEADIFQAT
jgi:hypothetical protein